MLYTRAAETVTKDDSIMVITEKGVLPPFKWSLVVDARITILEKQSFDCQGYRCKMAGGMEESVSIKHINIKNYMPLRNYHVF